MGELALIAMAEGHDIARQASTLAILAAIATACAAGWCDPPISSESSPVVPVHAGAVPPLPDSWLPPPNSATAEPVRADEVERSRRVLALAMQKYPDDFLRAELDQVWVCGRLVRHGAKVGGSYRGRDVFIVNEGVAGGYSDDALEATFHHEFAHILHHKYAQHFPTDRWQAVNDNEFKYSGNPWLKRYWRRRTRNHDLLRGGFVREYSTATIKEDFANVAGSLFLNREHFWRKVRTFPRLEQKVTLAIEFYSAVDPRFTEAYFRSLPPVGVSTGDLPDFAPEDLQDMTEHELRAALLAIANARSTRSHNVVEDMRLQRQSAMILDRLRQSTGQARRSTRPVELPPFAADLMELVPVHVRPDGQMNPQSWDHPPAAEPLRPTDRNDALQAIHSALAKYPHEVCIANLERIYVLGSLRWPASDWRGLATHSRNRLYLGVSQLPEVTVRSLETALHTEFAAILMRNYADRFPEASWIAANIDFEYKRPNASTLRELPVQFLPEHVEAGFLSDQSRASRWLDVMLIAGQLFANRPEFWAEVDEHPALAHKVKLVMIFYSKIDPQFTESFFRQSNHEP